MKEAKIVDQILQSEDIPEKYNEYNSPLFGVPFSCKECFWVKGNYSLSSFTVRFF
jgi:hypothetical protein